MNSMAPREYARFRRQIEDEYKRRLQSLDDLWSLGNPGVRPPDWDEETLRKDPCGHPGGLPGLISHITSGLNNGWKFTAADMCDLLKSHYLAGPIVRSSVSYALIRLATDGVAVKFHRRGRGRSPSVFEVANGLRPQKEIDNVG